MFPLVAAAVGVGALGAVGKFLGGRDQAAELRRQTRETVRRMGLDAARTRSEADALGAASGVEFEGSNSLQLYLTQMSQEFKRRIDFTRTSGMRQAGNAESAATFGLFSDLAGTAFGAASMMGYGKGAPTSAGADVFANSIGWKPGGV